MFVQLCIILRITLHPASHHYRVDGVNITPCDEIARTGGGGLDDRSGSFLVQRLLAIANNKLATKEPPRDLIPKTTLKELKDLPPNEIAGIRDMGMDLLSKKMWINNPLLDHSRTIQQNLNQVNLLNDDRLKPDTLRPPHSITKLAKTLTYGFDPYFSKGSFEPFETRPKPITLVAFRKNGLAPRESMKHEKISSAEIAELQSPFNTISSF